MSFAGKLIELEITISSEISQTQKDKYHVFSHIQNLDVFRRHESRRETIWERKGTRRSGREKRQGNER
jgi:hypothetical protein